ncbi:MAG: S-layer homology domain-containing protein [Cyanobacteria bacterium P01_D01_bin.73]
MKPAVNQVCNGKCEMELSDSDPQPVKFFLPPLRRQPFKSPALSRTVILSRLLSRFAVGLCSGLGAIAISGCTESLENSLAADPSLSTPQPTASSQPAASPDPKSTAPQSTPVASTEPTPSASPAQSPDPEASPTPEIAPAPEALRSYVEDWERTGVLEITDPNQPITRRTLARWLFAANNALYSDRPAQQIRPAQSNAEPTFQDLNADDPDFAAIQGLAEAGIIPSPLTGSATSVKFEPDVIATRETLLRWKVPLDFRATLSPATVDAIAKAWGFQDTNKIDPNALKFVFADYQNGDLSNIRRTFGFTTLLQPKKTITQAEAAAALWHFGIDGQGKSAADLDIKPNSSNDDNTEPAQ